MRGIHFVVTILDQSKRSAGVVLMYDIICHGPVIWTFPISIKATRHRISVISFRLDHRVNVTNHIYFYIFLQKLLRI